MIAGWPLCLGFVYPVFSNGLVSHCSLYHVLCSCSSWLLLGFTSHPQGHLFHLRSKIISMLSFWCCLWLVFLAFSAYRQSLWLLIGLGYADTVGKKSVDCLKRRSGNSSPLGFSPLPHFTKTFTAFIFGNINIVCQITLMQKERYFPFCKFWKSRQNYFSQSLVHTSQAINTTSFGKQPHARLPS